MNIHHFAIDKRRARAFRLVAKLFAPAVVPFVGMERYARDVDRAAGCLVRIRACDETGAAVGPWISIQSGE